jgi:hypothetical protein
MTFHLRSLSARRYRVEGDLPSVHDPAFAKRLTDRRFRPLSAHEERAFGWTTADNLLDTRFAADSLERGSCAVFALRVDRRRVSGRLLRAMVDLEMRGRAKEAGIERAAPGAARRPKPAERAEVRRAIAADLLAKASPAIEVHPVLWYPRRRLALFLSLSRTANETFRTLFCDTFDVTLSALTPFHRALELLEGRGAAEALAPVKRTEFSPAAYAVGTEEVVP